MKNKLGDLNNHLFAQLERLGDEDLQGEALSAEIARAQAVTAVACQVVNCGALALKARMAMVNSISEKEMPKMLEA